LSKWLRKRLRRSRRHRLRANVSFGANEEGKRNKCESTELMNHVDYSLLRCD
jgi:hypothetical protein